MAASRRLGHWPVHRHQPVARILNVRRHRVARNHLGIGRGRLVLIHRAQPLAHRARQVGRNLHGVRLACIGIADRDPRLVALGVERIGIRHRLQPGDRGRDSSPWLS